MYNICLQLVHYTLAISTALGVSPFAIRLLPISCAENCFLVLSAHSGPFVAAFPCAHLGNVVENLTVSTEYARFSLATNSATSRRGAFESNVLTSGWPPTCRRIWRRVCGASELLPPPNDAVGFGVAAGVSTLSPLAAASRRAFSRAAFSARSRLSASICALIAARARWSSSFSACQLTVAMSVGAQCYSCCGLKHR